jgi:hypothetical protein
VSLIASQGWSRDNSLSKSQSKVVLPTLEETPETAMIFGSIRRYPAIFFTPAQQ